MKSIKYTVLFVFIIGIGISILLGCKEKNPTYRAQALQANHFENNDSSDDFSNEQKGNDLPYGPSDYYDGQDYPSTNREEPSTGDLPYGPSDRYGQDYPSRDYPSSGDLPPIEPPGGPYYPEGTPQRNFPQILPPGPRLPLQTSPGR